MNFAEILQALAEGNVADFSDEQLAEHRETLRAGALSISEKDEITAEDLDQMRTAKAGIEALDAERDRRKALNDEIDEIASDLAEESDESEEAEEAESLQDSSDSEDDEDEEEDGSDEGSDNAGVTAAAPVKRHRKSAVELNSVAPDTPPAPETAKAPRPRLTAASGVNGFAAGEEFENSVDLGRALLKRFEDIKGGGTEKIAVANLKANFTEQMTLGSDPAENLEKFGGIDPTAPEAVAASLACTPREPLYDVGFDSSTARPLLASLPRRRAPRGGYTVYPSPVLADVADAAGSGDGTGVWTETEDDDVNAVKNACAVITCSSPVQYDIYGVYRCLTVRNLLQMTFPELVEAYLNKLTALWARLAEVTLADAMLADGNLTAITETAASFSANQNLIDIITRVLTVYREQERYGDAVLDVWMHRWVRDSLKVDAGLMTKYDSTLSSRVASDADINRFFADLGVRPHFLYDTPTGWTGIAAQGAGALQAWPTTVEMIVAPAGNYQHLDQGTLQLGVTNRVPWDKDDMERNQFTMFWESYEGLLAMGAPTYSVTISGLDPNGQQRGYAT